MLQVVLLRSQRDRVIEKLGVKNFSEPQLVDEIIALDDERKRMTFEFDETKSKINAASKEIGQLMAKGQKAEAEEKKKSVEVFKQSLAPIEQQLAAIEKKLEAQLLRLPNLPADEVPRGKTPEDNETV